MTTTKTKEEIYRAYISRLRSAALAVTKVTDVNEIDEVHELELVILDSPDTSVWCFYCGLSVERCELYQLGDRHVMVSKKCCPDCSHGKPDFANDGRPHLEDASSIRSRSSLTDEQKYERIERALAMWTEKFATGYEPMTDTALLAYEAMLLRQRLGTYMNCDRGVQAALTKLAGDAGEREPALERFLADVVAATEGDYEEEAT